MISDRLLAHQTGSNIGEKRDWIGTDEKVNESAKNSLKRAWTMKDKRSCNMNECTYFFCSCAFKFSILLLFSQKMKDFAMALFVWWRGKVQIFFTPDWEAKCCLILCKLLTFDCNANFKLARCFKFLVTGDLSLPFQFNQKVIHRSGVHMSLFVL